MKSNALNRPRTGIPQDAEVPSGRDHEKCQQKADDEKNPSCPAFTQAAGLNRSDSQTYPNWNDKRRPTGSKVPSDGQSRGRRLLG